MSIPRATLGLLISTETSFGQTNNASMQDISVLSVAPNLIFRCFTLPRQSFLGRPLLSICLSQVCIIGVFLNDIGFPFAAAKKRGFQPKLVCVFERPWATRIRASLPNFCELLILIGLSDCVCLKLNFKAEYIC